MKTLNLNSKVLVIPMDQLPKDVINSIKQEDGPQEYNGIELFVYASSVPEVYDECECSCDENGCECTEESCQCQEDGSEFIEQICQCTQEGEKCECTQEDNCGCKEESCKCTQEGEKCECTDKAPEERCGCSCGSDDQDYEYEFLDEDDDEDYQSEDFSTIQVIDEPVVIINTEDAEKLGFIVTEDMLFNMSEDGLTLVPGASIGKDGHQPNAITINVE